MPFLPGPQLVISVDEEDPRLQEAINPHANPKL